MTRQEVYSLSVEKLAHHYALLLELPTGFGKTAISLQLVNYLLHTNYKDFKGPQINIMILVAKRVHKQTWKEEITKWGGIQHPKDGMKINIHMECYESLKKHVGEEWEIILADEVHHIGSDTRMHLLNKVKFCHLIGLSATIPRPVKQYFKFRYHSETVSCRLSEAIRSDILPEPQILLFPLLLDNRQPTEQWEFHPKASGPVVHAEYKDIRKYRYNKNVHSIVTMTQKQKLMEFDSLIDFFKKNADRSVAAKRSWLFQAGKRLEFLADIKVPILKDILKHIRKSRSITFCKTIQQCEKLGNSCIHSKNAMADIIYEEFNNKEIDHITAVNILNENANLVDCKYAIFCNLSSSDVMVPQRIGRSLRHKSPVIIIPYYQGTREEELVGKITENFDKSRIKTIHSISEI